MRFVGCTGMGECAKENIGRRETVSVSAHPHCFHVVEQPRAWNMRALVRVRIAHIDDPNLWIVEVCLEPIGGNEW